MSERSKSFDPSEERTSRERMIAAVGGGIAFDLERGPNAQTPEVLAPTPEVIGEVSIVSVTESAPKGVLARVAKIAGSAVVSGIAAYGVARGMEALVAVDPTEVYEFVAAGTGAVVGGALTALATEK